MATFQGPTDIGPYNANSYFTQRAFYTFNTTVSSPTYIHMKTNIGGLSNYAMYMIEAVGYNYGVGAAIRCAWGFYLYSPAATYATGTLNSVGLKNQFGGMSADGVYMSSDYFVTIRAAVSSNYFNGFTLNGYSVRTDTGAAQNISIQAAVQTSNSGNYY